MDRSGLSGSCPSCRRIYVFNRAAFPVPDADGVVRTPWPRSPLDAPSGPFTDGMDHETGPRRGPVVSASDPVAKQDTWLMREDFDVALLVEVGDQGGAGYARARATFERGEDGTWINVTEVRFLSGKDGLSWGHCYAVALFDVAGRLRCVFPVACDRVQEPGDVWRLVPGSVQAHPRPVP
jgi:hypothetical protein